MTSRLAPPPAAALSDAGLTPAQFQAISTLVYEISGIQLREGKEGLVRSRLAKRLRALNLTTYDAYLAQVDDDARERAEMIDLLTTNKTNFFRESAHFDFVRDVLVPQWLATPSVPLRIWSAGCSSGEEPYTLAMVLRDAVPDLDRRDVKILATDLSHRVLAHARAGIYSDAAIAGVSAEQLKRHFTRVAAPGDGGRGAGVERRGGGCGS
jgi:chemotaxis protein methyltransferase CheR